MTTSLYIFFPLQIFSENKILQIDQTTNNYAIKNFTYVLEDPTLLLTIDSVFNKEKLFHHDNNNLTYGMSNSRYWIKLSLKNTTKNEIRLILTVGNPDINELNFYQVAENRVTKHIRTGEVFPYNSREIPHRNFLFKLIIEPCQNYTFYISSFNNGDPNFIPLSLLKENEFNNQDNYLSIINGILFGILIFIVIFNIFLFIAIYERIYIVYSFYVFSILMLLMSADGYAYQYLWHNSPWFSNRSQLFFLALSGMFQMLFIQLFLKLKKQFKLLNQAINLIIFLCFISAIMSLLSHPLYLISLNIIYFIIFIAYIPIFLSSYFYIKKKYLPSYYLLAAFSFTFLGGIFSVSRDIGIIPTNLYVNFVLKLSFTIETLILTSAVIDRFIRSRKQIENDLAIQKKETEHKNQELEAINLELKKFSMAATLTDNGIIIINKFGKVTWVNEGFNKLFGIDDRIIKRFKSFYELINLLDNDRAYYYFKKCMEDKLTVSFEIEIKLRSTEKIWVFTTFTPVFDNNGHVDQIIGICSNITKKILAEKLIKESEERFRTLFENMTEGVALHEMIYDKKNNPIDYRILNVNNAYEKHTGIHLVDAIGSLASELYKVVNAPYLTEYASVALSGKPFSFETHFEQMGKYFNISVFSPKQHQFGTVFFDITDRKQAEKAVIENQRLGAIGEMASSIAHDFNNTLQAIYGNIELAILTSDLSDNTLQYLTSIKTAASDASERVQQIQRFGGKTQFKNQYSAIDLNLLISKVIIQIRPLWKDKAEEIGISITINHKQGLIPRISGNHGDICSALFNIIKNGIEALPEGGRITIKTEKKTEGVVVTIKDTGIGMNEETKTRIFQPFYSTKGFEIGRGLGMSGVHSIIKEHGGEISVLMTAPGKGTTIKIVFPFVQENETQEIQKKEIKFTAKISLTILWVEDDADIRLNAGMIMEMLGHKVDTACNGVEALEYLKQHKYDIVFTDIGMPVMNGWMLADMIKEQFGGKMKVVVVSGWGSEMDDDKKNKHGIEYVLNKPFTIEEIEKFLEKTFYNNN